MDKCFVEIRDDRGTTSYINIQQIAQIQGAQHGDWTIFLADGRTLNVSHPNAQEVIKWLPLAKRRKEGISYG